MDSSFGLDPHSTTDWLLHTMGSLFSSLLGKKKKEPELNQQDKAVLDLKRQRDRLQKDTKKLDGVIAREKQIALELFRAGKKERAMLALKKKKYQENQLRNLENHMVNLEQLVNSIRFAEVQNDVFQALKEGNEALKKINQEVSIEEVEKLMEETAEAQEYQQHISELLGAELTEEDDADVLAELEAIENEDIAQLDMPEVPDKPIAKPEEKVEDEEPHMAMEDEAPAKQKAEPALVAA